jgi:hypothetical protein
MEGVREEVFLPVLKRVIIYLVVAEVLLLPLCKEAAFGLTCGTAASLLNFYLLYRSIRALSASFLRTRVLLHFYARMFLYALCLFFSMKEWGFWGFFSCFAGCLMVKFALFERYVMKNTYLGR